MHDLKWTEREKKIAHQVFDAALERELSEVVADFKQRAERAQKPDDLWAIEGWLAHRRRDIDTKYVFRYSQLIIVFGTLLREGRITRQQLEGLAEDKLSYIERFAAF